MSLIEVKQLTKEYKSRIRHKSALKTIASFIKLLSGILTPTAGEILIDGRQPVKHRKENALNMGVVFGQRSQFYWDLPLGGTSNAGSGTGHTGNSQHHKSIPCSPTGGTRSGSRLFRPLSCQRHKCNRIIP